MTWHPIFPEQPTVLFNRSRLERKREESLYPWQTLQSVTSSVLFHRFSSVIKWRGYTQQVSSWLDFNMISVFCHWSCGGGVLG